jgi:hypothetical protein
MQAAASQGVLPSQQDVDKEKDQIRRTRPSIITQAQVNDPTLALFDQALMVKMALRNLQIKNVKVSPSEVQAFYNLHKSSFVLPEQTSSTVIFAKDDVAAQTAVSMLQHADDIKVIAQTPGLAVMGLNTKSMPNIPKAIVAQVLAMKTGDIKVFSLGNVKMVVRPNVIKPAGIQSLDQIYDTVAMDAKLAKAPSEQQEIGMLLRDAHITVESDKYAGAVPQMNTQVASAQ